MSIILGLNAYHGDSSACLVKGGKLIARERETGKQVEMTKDQLIKEIKEKTKDMPFKPLPLPKELSKRPIFVG